MPVIEMARLDADSLRELIEGLIAANKALALKVEGLERAVEALKKPGFPDWIKTWPRPPEPTVRLDGVPFCTAQN